MATLGTWSYRCLKSRARKQGSLRGLEIARAERIPARRFLGICPVFANDVVVRAASTNGRARGRGRSNTVNRANVVEQIADNWNPVPNHQVL